MKSRLTIFLLVNLSAARFKQRRSCFYEPRRRSSSVCPTFCYEQSPSVRPSDFLSVVSRLRSSVRLSDCLL